MTKLSKVPPPANPGKTHALGALETAVPYENLQRASQSPVPVTTAVLPSSYNDPLPDTNPFSPNFQTGFVSNNTPSDALSPVSPVVEPEPNKRPSQAPAQTSQPQRPPEQRKSVDLYRLDGKPYPDSNAAPGKEKIKVVRVAKDMLDGALPPAYQRQYSDTQRQHSDTVKPDKALNASPQAHECGKCGKKRDTLSHDHNCKHCGKRKSSAPAWTTPNAVPAPMAQPAPAVHARTISESRNSHGSSRMSASTAGPSSSPSSTGGPRCCAKCGRYKRPSNNPFDQGRPNGNGPATAPVPMAGHPGMRPGLSIQPYAPANNPAYPHIDVIPPSASTTYKAVTSTQSNYGDDSPLVSKAPKQEFKLFRNSSLARSLSRRLSKRDKGSATPPEPLPSQQLARQSGEQSAGNLINMISTAMQGPTNDRDAQYLVLSSGGDQAERPETPFSFVGGKDEVNAFEMVHLRDRDSVSSHDAFNEPARPHLGVTHSDDEVFAGTGIPQDTIDSPHRSRSTGPERQQHLTVDDGDGHQITRFKSLRQGVTRMSSDVSRSTSLRRLGSLKTVHHAWYVEGTDGNNDNIIPAF